MHRCKGCGVFLQTDDPNQLGFIMQKGNTLCNRCFRIQNYNEYQKVYKENNDYVSILKKVNDTKDLVILVVDLFFFPKNLASISNIIQNDILLVLTKRDVLPKKINDEKLIQYFKKLPFHIVDIEVISSLKNYHFDELLEKIMTYKKSENVYVVGYTNAGKSTMINKIIYHYSDKGVSLTTSIMPSTTLDQIEIKVKDDLTLIDTPGLLIEKSLIDKVEGKLLKKIMPNKEVKPITYQIKKSQYIQIEDFLNIKITENNVTLYLSDKLLVKRFYKEKGKYPYHYKIEGKKDEDIVIEGLGFMTISKNSFLEFSSLYPLSIYTRKKLI